MQANATKRFIRAHTAKTTNKYRFDQASRGEKKRHTHTQALRNVTGSEVARLAVGLQKGSRKVGATRCQL